ncbi:tight adherence pilus pseudopilin TadF [Vibrio taketomensis]|uniref:tight adherence pilus pseudopilin TadF n=1 Tax=Vibrio taketomensis TaxID=2572923 RepID=UPI0013898A03|nr:tight adherence pilus pseudopilin TadF [Vibrio taketomensis]
MNSSISYKRRAKQKGTFTIEFAIVGLFLSLLFVFAGDMTIKLAHKGKLDRLSYSLVNILKERTQLYGKDFNIKPAEIESIANIARDSLRRTVQQFDQASFGYLIESVTFDQEQKPSYQFFNTNGVGVRCQAAQSLNQMQHLSKVTTWGRRATLYRVTLCYETDNWIGDLLDVDFTTVQSDAVMIGR